MLAACRVEPDSVPRLAEEAARQWTAQFNPRPVDTDRFIALYEAAFEPRTAREGGSACRCG
jgi:alcohol dehydrogenase